MSSIGYPDWQAAHDYTAGLHGDQVVVSNGYSGSQTATFYTVPAGKTLIIKSILVNPGVDANSTGPWGEFGIELDAAKGFDGASASSNILIVVARARLSTSDNLAIVQPGPISVAGGAAGNNLIIVATAVQATTTEAEVILYGVLV